MRKYGVLKQLQNDIKREGKQMGSARMGNVKCVKERTTEEQLIGLILSVFGRIKNYYVNTGLFTSIHNLSTL
jgi:rRNA processing protein Gar1